MKNQILPALALGIALLSLLLLIPALINLLPFPGGVFSWAVAPWLTSFLLFIALCGIVLLGISAFKKLGQYGILGFGFLLGFLLSLSAEGSQGPMLGSGFSASYFFVCGFSAALTAQIMALVFKPHAAEKSEEVIALEPQDLSPDEVEERYESTLSAREKDFRWRLHSTGYRYNLHGKFQKSRLPGLPTLVLPRYHSVIFIRKCKEHGHVGCREFNINEMEATAREKVYQVKAKDDTDIRVLRGKGWKVIEVWECKLREESLNSTLHQVTRELDIALQRRGSAS